VTSTSPSPIVPATGRVVEALCSKFKITLSGLTLRVSAESRFCSRLRGVFIKNRRNNILELERKAPPATDRRQQSAILE
jgi:hypothetical protein